MCNFKPYQSLQILPITFVNISLNEVSEGIISKILFVKLIDSSKRGLSLQNEKIFIMENFLEVIGI